MTGSWRSLICVCVMAGSASSAVAQQVSTQAKQRAEAVLASMPQATNIEQVAISPDGSSVAYATANGIQVASLADAMVRQKIEIRDVAGLRDVAWSADGKQIAFLADRKSEVPQSSVWVAEGAPFHPKLVADLKGYVQDPRFSPDGKTLAVLFIEGMPRIAGPLQPMTPLSGVVEEKFYEQRVTTIDLANANAIKQVTPAGMYIYEYDWMPDGRGWAVTAAPGSGDNNWWIARLYTADAASGQLREIYKPKLQIAQPKVSPDGKTIAFIEGLMSDEGPTGGDVFAIPVSGGAPKNLTSGMKATAETLHWIGADTIGFGENIDGDAGLASVSANGGAVRQLWQGPEVATAAYNMGASWSRDGNIVAAIRQSASMAPEVWAGPIGKWKQVSQLNAGAKPAWGEAKNVHWMNGDARVQGWLLLPKDYDAGKKYPLVVTVHGGPSSACTNGWAARNGALSAMGWFELCPNPRGSYGQGEAFVRGNVKDFGGGDYRDIMAGVEALQKQYPIDPKRVGIHGHSYGGYMTMWAETQTNQFAAAVAGAGLSDWLSYYGQNDIDQWMLPFFGASVYDDPAVYAQSDPMHFVTHVKTPTLILVGDRDGEVPASQSVEWWHALKSLNVPTELVVYPGEGHAISRDPAHRKDYELRTLEWFEEWFAKAK